MSERRDKDGRLLSPFQSPQWMAKILKRRSYKNVPHGEESGRAKLKEVDVLTIRKPDSMPRSLAGKYARRYNIAPGYVYQLRRGVRWAWFK